MKTQHRVTQLLLAGNSAILCLLVAYFLFIPGLLVLRNVRDPAIRTGDIPREAWRIHRHLAPRYERWARERIESGKAAEVHTLDVPGTEWPLFGSVFYLWATENLQEAWEKEPGLSARAPAEYAAGAVEACKDLLLDPVHHSWVKDHWGDDYLHIENVFFRSLLIAGLTSYERLTGSGETLAVLRDQLDTLSQDLDESPFGVLHDYPGECYPIDVFAAVAWIRRGDTVAGTDHSAFIERERRAFQGLRLDSRGLIPWIVDPRTGSQWEASRGIVNAHVLVFARDVYPDLAKTWYDLYEEHFWQETWWAAGFREFYRDRPDSEWTYDVDSGPIVGGFSPSANAFGVAAARVNGRLDHAYSLTAQVLAACWPLPDGRLLGARMLSDPEHAPYLGEAGILWQLTETPHETATIVPAGRAGGAVRIGYVFYFGNSLLVFAGVWLRLRRWKRMAAAGTIVPWVQGQALLWVGLVLVAVLLAVFGQILFAVLCLLFAQFLPRSWRPRIG